MDRIHYSTLDVQCSMFDVHFSVNSSIEANIIESGRSEIARLDDDQRKVWADTMRPVWDTFTPSIGDDLLNAALAAGQE